MKVAIPQVLFVFALNGAKTASPKIEGGDTMRQIKLMYGIASWLVTIGLWSLFHSANVLLGWNEVICNCAWGASSLMVIYLMIRGTKHIKEDIGLK